MTKMEYAKLVCRLYEVANNSDQPLRAEPWINPEACSLHCRAYDKSCVIFSQTRANMTTLLQL